MSTNIVIMSSLVVLIVLAVTLLGLWTYRDAKSKGLNAGLWTAIVLFVPNLIGLLLYFLVGRREVVKCRHCSGSVQSGNKFCPHCGERMITSNTSEVSVNRGVKGLLIGFIVCIVLMITIAVGSFALAFRNDPSSFSSKIAIGMVESNIGDKWNLSFMSLSGETKKSLRIKNGVPEKIYIKSDVNSGSLTLDIVQGEKRITIDLDNGMEQIEKPLEGFEEGKVTMIIRASSAKEGKVNIWWE